MTNTWEANKKYYVLLNQGQLKQVLGEILEGIMKYKPRKDGQDWMLEHCMRGVKYLAGNKVAISLQITNGKYVEYETGEGEYKNIEVVDAFITSQDFDLAMYMFEVDEVMTQEEYNNLEDITNINLK